MKFNVSLDIEQIDQIASITADKVLATVKYTKDREESYEREIKQLKHMVIERDSMLVQKDICINRLRDIIKRQREEIENLNKK